MRIFLRAGEKIFVNGAVISVNQKTSINLLNDAVFLLGSHVLQVEETTTPLKQLYFVIQNVLIEPTAEGISMDHYKHLLSGVRHAFSNLDVHSGLDDVERHVENKRYFDALKVLRKLFPVEQEIMEGLDDASQVFIRPLAATAAA
ncbi:flagellar biosynthesis repressor [Rhodobacteraceae bacterium RKSG542]|uniref:flagellar biosynthesis repressor FlbT n=1 Tax=Pseudovibrio flavus TaxID=2529854 RepID=UPI0012BC0141|nr:flagellar biosynthesis repressor FlbT [Pseudovibrio flavus]MTI16764.1 flagellar biosynthesis repressor [Pseudovibrio flavus]